MNPTTMRFAHMLATFDKRTMVQIHILPPYASHATTHAPAITFKLLIPLFRWFDATSRSSHAHSVSRRGRCTATTQFALFCHRLPGRVQLEIMEDAMRDAADKRLLQLFSGTDTPEENMYS